MPTRPENKARYPRNWAAISLRIRTLRAQNQCECDGLCGYVHHVDGAGRQQDLRPGTEEVPRFRCTAINHAPHPVTGSRVVLTVAHLDHVPENCAARNLKALCQRCHNMYDNKHRRRGMQERARLRRANGDFFRGPYSRNDGEQIT